MQKVLAIFLALFTLYTHAEEQVKFPSLKDGKWCKLPHHKLPAKPRVAARAAPVTEVEPNGTRLQAQAITFASDGSAAVSGTLATDTEVDYYKVTVQRGDVLAFVMNSNFDSVGAVEDAQGALVMDNDDLTGLPQLYPPNSPLPLPQNPDADLNCSLSLVMFTAGDYFIKISSYNSSSSGPYILDMRLIRPFMETQSASNKQVIFVDFNGASGIDALTLFGDGSSSATLSPLSSFLTNWGLTNSDEPLLIDKVMTIVNAKFDALRIPALNGNFPVDAVPGHFDVEFRNSKDHADPFGVAPNVSRVIVGGSQAESGIQTVGIASSIDPGNFNTADTALVLLDELSAPAGGPDSVNTLTLAANYQKIDAVALAIANVVVHEAGHFLGCFHCDNSNGVNAIMDAGGLGIEYRVGAGTDNILGTNDDFNRVFTVDDYDPFEGTSYTAGVRERADFNVAMALSTPRAIISPGGGGVGGTGLFATTAPCPGGTAILGAATASGTGTGTEPLPCFTQNLGGGTGPVTVVFDPSCSYMPVAPAGVTYLYQAVWNFGDGTPALAVPAAPNADPLQALATVSKIYCGDTIYEVTLRIDITIVDATTSNQSAGPSNFVKGQVHVANVNFPPAPSILNNTSAPTGTLPYVLTLDIGNSFDEDGYIIWASVDWGDGTAPECITTPINSLSPVLTHTYVTAGVFQVTVSTIDNGRLPAGTVSTFAGCDDPAAALAAIITQQQNSAILPALKVAQLNPLLTQSFLTINIPGNMFALKGSFKLDFRRAGNDKFDVLFQSNIQPPSVSSVPVVVTIGTGASAKTLNFTTNARGRFKDGTTMFDYNGKKQQLRLKLSRTALAAALGRTNATVVNASVDVPVSVTINGTTNLSSNVRFSYNATIGKQGLGKNAISYPIGN